MIWTVTEIYTKIEARKVFGDIVTDELKLKIENSVSKFQIGAMVCHRPQEHIFTIKSIISLYKMMGKGIILCLYDISKFFDRENLRDCMNELYKLNVKGKLYRLIFNLNKSTEICVKTSVGKTNSADVGEGLGQGTNEGAIVSSVSLAGGLDEKFKDSNDEVKYLDLPMAPIIFQDDIGRLAENLESVQMGYNRIEKMAEEKLLDFNLDKSCFLLIGNKKFRSKI